MMNYTLRFITKLFVCYLAISSVCVAAQEFPRAAVQAELTVRLINHVVWQNEAEFETFNIVFYGSDPDYYQFLERSVLDRVIRSKKIRLSSVGSLSDMTNVHVLVVSAIHNLSLAEIAREVRNTNTLLVSEDADERLTVMINFSQHDNGTISFKLNRSNMLLEKLSISKDILLLGGTELDVASLYREMEQGVIELEEKLKLTLTQATFVNAALVNSQVQLKNLEGEMLDTRSEMVTVNRALQNQKNLIVEQEAAIATRQSRLEQVSASSLINQKLLVKQDVLLADSALKIKQQREEVNSNQRLLDEHAGKLAALSSDVIQQSTKIRAQEQLLYFSLVVLTVFLLLVFVIYRISRDRHRFSLELERRGIELEDEVKSRTLEATESERHFRALSELSPVGVFQIDIYGSCFYVNERWCEYSGLTRQQAKGFGWLDAVHPDDRSNLSEHWEAQIQQEEFFNSEYRYLALSGKVTWLIGQLQPEYEPDGRLKGYIGTVTDVTNQKQLQEQLRQTQKMDALGMLTGGIAHDYNNMLTIVSGFAELLQISLKEQPGLLKFVDQIVHASARGAALTKKLLAFSRHHVSNAGEFNINLIIRFQQQMLEKTLTPRIRLNLLLDENLWLSWIDDGDLEDALVNMSINAMHAMDGAGELTISSKNITLNKRDAEKLNIKPGDFVQIKVVDTGSGMDEETKEKLFDPFYSTKGLDGTGLGLTQVYSFVERSQGFIRVESFLGRGTEFHLYFPRHFQEAEIVQTDQLAESVNLRGVETILITDDEPGLLKLVSEILTQEGYQTICAGSAEEALDLLRSNDVDLLLTDIVMPDTDGYDLAEEVQKLYPHIKIQLVSGYTDKHSRQVPDVKLAQELLMKPYKRLILLERIRILLDPEYKEPAKSDDLSRLKIVK